jgi:RND family efflux transporter MFP subunit
MKRQTSIIIGFIALALGVTGAIVLVKTRPQADRKRPQRMSPIVRSVSLVASNRTARLDLMGVVTANRSVALRSRVMGEIVGTHANWVEGGRMVEGEVMVQVDPTDYTNALILAESELDQAKAELALEMGRQDVAKREWKLLGQDAEGEDTSLALRVPQLASAKARVRAAGARVKLAQVNVARTSIRAPFNCLVLSRDADLGDQATTQTRLGKLADTDSYHVRVSVPVADLKWIEFPATGMSGSLARVYLPGGRVRDGKVIKLLGDLEPSGRTARVLVEVKDPLKANKEMLLGSYVRVVIEGRTITGAYAIQREHYREGGEVFLLTPTKTLRMVPVTIIWSDREQVVFRTDIEAGERLITSTVRAAVNGMALRTEEDAARDVRKSKGKRKP